MINFVLMRSAFCRGVTPAIGDATIGPGNPCASQKGAHPISTPTARPCSSSATLETHTSDLPLVRTEVFRNQPPHSSCSPGERELSNNINHSSLNGNSTVVRGRLISFQQLWDMGLISSRNFTTQRLATVP